MKKHFLTGLAMLLPLTITIYIFVFLLKILTTPFLGIAELFHIDSKVIILLILTLFIFILGVAGQWFLIHSFTALTSSIFRRIPFIGSIYNAFQEITQTLFTSKTNFSQVLLVPFPGSEALCLGLSSPSSNHLVAVFVPSSPNPTIGFVVHYKREEILYLDMKVDEALRCNLSCGVLAPELKVL